MTQFTLRTPLTQEQCLARLAAARDRDPFVWIWLDAAAGATRDGIRATPPSFRLQKRKSDGSRFQSYLSASLRTHGEGTTIEVVMRTQRHEVFLGVWLGLVILIGSAVFFSSLSTLIHGAGESQLSAVYGLLFPPALFAVGYRFRESVKRTARLEERFLTDFLMHTLNARTVLVDKHEGGP